MLPGQCWVSLLTLATVLLASCHSAQSGEVTGVVIDLQAQDIVHADSIQIRDASGRDWRFQVSPEVASDPTHPNPASHLRQHMVFGDPVVVQYRDTPAGLLAIRILDGPPPASSLASSVAQPTR